MPSAFEELVEAVKGTGGHVMQVYAESILNPENDHYVLVVLGRDNISDIRAAVEEVQRRWESEGNSATLPQSPAP